VNRLLRTGLSQSSRVLSEGHFTLQVKTSLWNQFSPVETITVCLPPKSRIQCFISYVCMCSLSHNVIKWIYSYKLGQKMFQSQNISCKCMQYSNPTHYI
jgi:hypothetical protein